VSFQIKVVARNTGRVDPSMTAAVPVPGLHSGVRCQPELCLLGDIGRIPKAGNRSRIGAADTVFCMSLGSIFLVGSIKFWTI